MARPPAAGTGQGRNPKGACGGGWRTSSAGGVAGAKDLSVMPAGRAGPSRRWEGCPPQGRLRLRVTTTRGRIPPYAAGAFRRGRGRAMPTPGAPPGRNARPSRPQAGALPVHGPDQHRRRRGQGQHAGGISSSGSPAGRPDAHIYEELHPRPARIRTRPRCRQAPPSPPSAGAGPFRRPCMNAFVPRARAAGRPGGPPPSGVQGAQYDRTNPSRPLRRISSRASWARFAAAADSLNASFRCLVDAQRPLAVSRYMSYSLSPYRLE